MDIFSNFYRAGAEFVGRHPEQGDANVRYFNETFHGSLEKRLGVLLRDAKEILSTPEHTGRETMTDTSFGGAFRQEWLVKDGKIMAIGPDGKMVELDPTKCSKEFGHDKAMQWLIEYIMKAFANGAKSIRGFQVDSSFSVKGCGGSADAAMFYNNSVIDPVAAGNMYMEWVQSTFGIGNSASSGSKEASADGAGGGAFLDASISVHNCTGCGRALGKDAGTCASCKTKKHEAVAHRVNK